MRKIPSMTPAFDVSCATLWRSSNMTTQDSFVSSTIDLNANAIKIVMPRNSSNFAGQHWLKFNLTQTKHLFMPSHCSVWSYERMWCIHTYGFMYFCKAFLTRQHPPPRKRWHIKWMWCVYILSLAVRPYAEEITVHTQGESGDRNDLRAWHRLQGIVLEHF